MARNETFYNIKGEKKYVYIHRRKKLSAYAGLVIMTLSKQLVRNQFDLQNADKFRSDTMSKFLTEFRKCAYNPIEDVSAPGSY